MALEAAVAAARAASPAGTAAAPAPAEPPPLHWLPPTLAAVSLRLHALDASLAYRPGSFPARDLLQVSLVAALSASSAACWLRLASQCMPCPAPHGMLLPCFPRRLVLHASTAVGGVSLHKQICLQSASTRGNSPQTACLQAYAYSQRPVGPPGPAGRLRTESNLPLKHQGKGRPTPFPSLPQVCAAPCPRAVDTRAAGCVPTGAM